MNATKGRGKRPKGLYGKNRPVSTRLSDTDYRTLVRIVQESGALSVAEYLRAVILREIDNRKQILAEGEKGER